MQSKESMYQKDRILMTLSTGTIYSILFLGAMSSISTNVFAAKFTANMSGSNEVPPVDTKATGKTTFRTANNDTTVKYKIRIGCNV
jgi:CHRD domain